MANRVRGFNLPEELINEYQRIANYAGLSLSKVVSLALFAQLGDKQKGNILYGITASMLMENEKGDVDKNV